MTKAKKSKKTKKTTKKSKKSTKNVKTTKRRGRPPGSKNKPKKPLGISSDEAILSSESLSGYGNKIATEDFDTALIKKLKSKQKAKLAEKIQEEYEPELEDEEDDIETYDIEGYDIETEIATEGYGLEEFGESIPKKAKRKKKKAFSDEIGIDSDFYESDYNIGEFQDYE